MKTLITGIKPTGKLTLGNYIGVLQHLKEYENEYEVFLMIADLHAITIPMDPKVLRENSRSLAAFILASGVSPERVSLFVQSHVPAHSELAIILQNYTYMGELSRMTQFKEKTQSENKTNIGTGLFTYPILMASDILLYDCEIVPIGEDQKQHLELTRNLAERLNNKYETDVFVVPTPIIPKTGARIKSLSDPMKKMSKSDPKGDIFLDEDIESIRKKIARAVTDSDGIIKYDIVNKPGVSNLLTIFASLNGISIKSSEKHFSGQNYGTLKKEVADIVVNHISLLQEKYKSILNSAMLDEILKDGDTKANTKATKVLRRVKAIVGLN